MDTRNYAVMLPKLWECLGFWQLLFDGGIGNAQRRRERERKREKR